MRVEICRGTVATESTIKECVVWAWHFGPRFFFLDKIRRKKNQTLFLPVILWSVFFLFDLFFLLFFGFVEFWWLLLFFCSSLFLDLKRKTPLDEERITPKEAWGRGKRMRQRSGSWALPRRPDSVLLAFLLLLLCGTLGESNVDSLLLPHESVSYSYIPIHSLRHCGGQLTFSFQLTFLL